MLLMHYLDVVYPLQFPFYKPRVEDGGRNWVLALLMRCRPLYNGALSLAAYHQSTVLVPNETGWLPAFPNPPFVGLSDVQEEYYTLVLGGLREHVAFLSKLGRREGLRDSIYILACVTQLILLEVSVFSFSSRKLLEFCFGEIRTKMANRSLAAAPRIGNAI